jgi:hypothetical protein
VTLARAVRIERVSEKDADAEEDEQCCHDLAHRLFPQPCHAGKGGLEKLAVNRVEDEGQHDRTPLFDPRRR